MAENSEAGITMTNEAYSMGLNACMTLAKLNGLTIENVEAFKQNLLQKFQKDHTDGRTLHQDGVPYVADMHDDYKFAYPLTNQVARDQRFKIVNITMAFDRKPMNVQEFCNQLVNTYIYKRVNPSGNASGDTRLYDSSGSATLPSDSSDSSGSAAQPSGTSGTRDKPEVVDENEEEWAVQYKRDMKHLSSQTSAASGKKRKATDTENSQSNIVTLTAVRQVVENLYQKRNLYKKKDDLIDQAMSLGMKINERSSNRELIAAIVDCVMEKIQVEHAKTVSA